MYSDDNSQSRKNRKEYTMGNLKWPEGKKCAVMFTFDVDGDTTWENGNRGLPNGEKYIKSLSVGQYGPKRCVDRILDRQHRLEFLWQRSVYFQKHWYSHLLYLCFPTQSNCKKHPVHASCRNLFLPTCRKHRLPRHRRSLG